ncbi:MAG TPA: hypothetical protein VII69_13155 [Candidatus Eremiobacteraceae bacterium]
MTLDKTLTTLRITGIAFATTAALAAAGCGGGGYGGSSYGINNPNPTPRRPSLPDRKSSA